jgi:hypothetical protein
MRRQKAMPPEKKRDYHVQVHFNQEELSRLYEVADEGYASLSLTLRLCFEKYYEEWQRMNDLERCLLWLKKE